MPLHNRKNHRSKRVSSYFTIHEDSLPPYHLPPRPLPPNPHHHTTTDPQTPTASPFTIPQKPSHLKPKTTAISYPLPSPLTSPPSHSPSSSITRPFSTVHLTPSTIQSLTDLSPLDLPLPAHLARYHTRTRSNYPYIVAEGEMLSPAKIPDVRVPLLKTMRSLERLQRLKGWYEGMVVREEEDGMGGDKANIEHLETSILTRGDGKSGASSGDGDTADEKIKTANSGETGDVEVNSKSGHKARTTSSRKVTPNGMEVKVADVDAEDMTLKNSHYGSADKQPITITLTTPTRSNPPLVLSTLAPTTTTTTTATSQRNPQTPIPTTPTRSFLRTPAHPQHEVSPSHHNNRTVNHLNPTSAFSTTPKHEVKPMSDVHHKVHHDPLEISNRNQTQTHVQNEGYTPSIPNPSSSDHPIPMSQHTMTHQLQIVTHHLSRTELLLDEQIFTSLWRGSELEAGVIRRDLQRRKEELKRREQELDGQELKERVLRDGELQD